MSKYDITKSWLNSDNFFKRAVAIWGYAMLGYLTVVLTFILIMLGLALVTSVFSALVSVF